MLSKANTNWHIELDTLYSEYLQYLTALELEYAKNSWQRFKQSLTAHIEFEEKHIEPLPLDWEHSTLKLIQSDHLILNRLSPKVDAALAAIQDAPDPRARLVEELDIFIKMRNVLRHHDLREVEQLYPQIEKQLDEQQWLQLGLDMRRAQSELK